MIIISRTSILIISIIALFISGCNFHGKNDSSQGLFLEFDSISLRLKHSETVFTIPSPNQTSIIIKNSNLDFYPEILAPSNNAEHYNTTLKKSLMLGIWGANISYLNLYRQKELAIKYLQDIQTTLEDMEIYQLIDKSLINNLMEGFGNNDSVTYYLAELYRKSDHLLQSNERRDLSALIIAGGWIESFYYLTSLYEKTKNNHLFTNILYQEEILNNLIKILSPFYEKSTEYKELIDGLIDISYEFEVIDKKKQTNSIHTDTILKFTRINNETNFVLTGSKLEGLHKMVSLFRNRILN